MSNRKRADLCKKSDTRRFRELARRLTNDCGGVANLNEAQRQLIRRCVQLSLLCEKWESDAASGKEIDLYRFQQATNTLGRGLERLKLLGEPLGEKSGVNILIRHDDGKLEGSVLHRNPVTTIEIAPHEALY